MLESCSGSERDVGIHFNPASCPVRTEWVGVVVENGAQMGRDIDGWKA